MIVENPPSFIVRTEAQKAAWDNGYRLERGIEGGWLQYASTTAPDPIWIAGVSEVGPWLLSLNHSGVAAEIGSLSVSPEPVPIVNPIRWRLIENRTMLLLDVRFVQTDL
jgi:hypothetical protein